MWKAKTRGEIDWVKQKLKYSRKSIVEWPQLFEWNWVVKIKDIRG